MSLNRVHMKNKTLPFNSSTTVYNTLFQAFRPYLVRVTFLIILGFLGRFLLLYNSRIIAEALDQSPYITAELLQELVYKLFWILLVSFIITGIFRVVFSALCAYAVSRIYDETTYRVSRFPLSFFDTQPVGKITARFSSDYGNIFRLFGGPLAEFFCIVFDIISIALIAALIHPLFILPMGFSLIIFYGILKYNQEKLRYSRSEVAQLRAPSVAHFSETVQGATNIKLAHANDKFTERFEWLDQIYLSARKLVFKRVFVFSTQLNIMSFILFILNGWLSIHLMGKNILGIGQVSIILGYTILSTHSLQMFFEWFSQFDEALIGVHRLDEYLRSPLEPDAILPQKATFETGHKLSRDFANTQEAKKAVNGVLSLENITLKYHTQKDPTLKNISLQIQPGDKIGIIGATGSGKSSLISSIMKLYPFNQGNVYIDNSQSMSLDFYRQHFAVVSQDTFFLQGSLKDNLDLAGKYPEDVLSRALNQVRIHLPLNHHIEEKGNNLSFGEKQLISLARCLLKDSPIVILDEATANIDPQSEQILTETLETALKNKTQIIVAHRLVTIEKCDRLVWIDRGQIKMMGPVDEVLKVFKANSF